MLTNTSIFPNCQNTKKGHHSHRMDSSSNLGDNISKSSLVSLKAELLRKQQEVRKLVTDSAAASDGSAPVNCAKFREKPVKKLTIHEKSNRNVATRAEKDAKSADVDPEEVAQLKKSQDALVAKSKLYEDLMKGKQVLEGKQVLVNFDEKRKEEESGDEESDDDDWTEFTDALGRTRKCLKEDLKYYQDQNKHLEKLTQAANTCQPKPEADNKAPAGFSAELLSSDMKRELLRKQWEEEEQELAGKSDIHYQDILFSEARQHGVGFFRFSSDEATRAAQLSDLEATRTATLDARAKAKEVARLRKRQFKMRLRMTENRKRESQGLPPLPLDNLSSDDEADTTDEAQANASQQAAVSDLVARKLEEIRKANKTREWDVGKDGQMSQDEWVAKKREERITEFAPPTSLTGGSERDGRGRREITDAGHREREVFDDRSERDIDRWNEEGENCEERFVERNREADRRELRGCSGEEMDEGRAGAGFDNDGRRDEGWSIHGFKHTDRRHGDKYSKRNEYSEHSRRHTKEDSRNEDSRISNDMTDKQLMTQLELEESRAAKSMYCFKRKWADRSQEGPRRGQKVDMPLVDTRFISNNERKAEVVRLPGVETEPTIETRSVRNEGKKCKVDRGNVETVGKATDDDRDDIAKKMDTDEFKHTLEVDEDLIGPPIPSALSRKSEPIEESADNRKQDTLTVGDEIIPSELKAKQTESDLIGPAIPMEQETREIEVELCKQKDLVKETCEDIIGPPIPNQPSIDLKEPSTTTQPAMECKRLLLPATLVPRQAAKAPLVPTSLRPRQLTSPRNTLLKTGKLPGVNKRTSGMISKTVSPERRTEESPSSNSDSVPIFNGESKKEVNVNSEPKAAKSNDYFRQLFEDSRTASAESSEVRPDTKEVVKMSDSNDSSSNVENDDSKETTLDSTPDESPSNVPDSEQPPNSTFNFLEAKSKTGLLKRKLDRPNIQFDASGQIVKKIPEPFRSRTKSTEVESEDSRRGSSKKFVEIAPPTSMEYYTSFSSRGKKRGGASTVGSGRGMLEAVKKGIERVEREKKNRAEKKEKGLLDIM